MVTMWTSQEDGINAYTDRGIECRKEFIADLRISPTGTHAFLIAGNCNHEAITRMSGLMYQTHQATENEI